MIYVIIKSFFLHVIKMVYSLQNVLQYESFFMCIVFLLNGVFPVIVYKVCIFYNWVNNDLGFYDNSIHA